MTRRREAIDEFTERAIKATEASKLIPPIVYLPKRLRANGHRITADMVRVTVEPPTLMENQARIADADPVGFLIAIMHGQPIPAFHITGDGAIRIEYYVAPPAIRIRIAGFLSHKVTQSTHMHGKFKKGPLAGSDEDAALNWGELVEERANAAATTQSPDPADDSAGEG